MQWKHMRFTYTEANLLPDEHEVNLEYNAFLDKFGEEGNLIILGIKDSSVFTPSNFIAWNLISEKINDFNEVEFTLSIGNLQKLEKRKDTTAFLLIPFILVLNEIF